MDARAFTRDDLSSDEDDFYFMAHLAPRETGLPFHVWISTEGGARRDARVMAGQPAKAMPLRASVSIRPAAELKEGEIAPADLALLARWIDLNRDVLVRYWEGEIDSTQDALAALRPLDP